MKKISKERFNDILRRYRSGECTAEERALIDAWYAAIHENPGSEEGDPEEVDRLNQKMWSVIREKAFCEDDGVRQIGVHRLSRTRFVYYSLAAAAVITFVIIASVFFLRPSGLREKDALAVENGNGVKLIEIFNNRAELRLVVLPDKSTVQLEPGSKVVFPQRFSDNDRKITFDGEGFFQIEKDPNRPFYVYTADVVTKVLGTSFTIRAFQKEPEVVVAVRTGRVSVYAHNDAGDGNVASTETILTPNQQAIYSKPTHTLSRTLVDNPQPIVPKESLSAIHFENAPISEIFQAIEDVYQIDIRFNERLLAGCRLTTSISDGGMYDRLDIICTAIRATYKVEDTHIVINGAGCGR
jgi:ferric-dicitrate binding protein FerR (iron transport regulator)